MRTPTFGYPGGKARLRKWLLEYFPESCRVYFEPFAGRGNVFYLAKQEMEMEYSVLNDNLTAPFFRTLKTFDPNDLPENITREDYNKYRANPDEPVAVIVEGRITFGGSGYHGGGFAEPSSRNHICYSKKNYSKLIEVASKLIQKTIVTDYSWEKHPLWSTLTEEDFVYLDPPYLAGTSKIRTYKNIDHEALLNMLKTAKFKWVLSGYPSELYEEMLGPPKASKSAFRAMSHAATKHDKSEPKFKAGECIWSNL